MFESISFVSGHGLRTGLDDGGILGSILFVLQNSWHFWTVEEYLRIYFICTAKFLKILGRGGILGSILFVLPNSWHFWMVEEYLGIYFICTANYIMMQLQRHRSMKACFHAFMPQVILLMWHNISFSQALEQGRHL